MMIFNKYRSSSFLSAAATAIIFTLLSGATCTTNAMNLPDYVDVRLYTLIGDGFCDYKKVTPELELQAEEFMYLMMAEFTNEANNKNRAWIDPIANTDPQVRKLLRGGGQEEATTTTTSRKLLVTAPAGSSGGDVEEDQQDQQAHRELCDPSGDGISTCRECKRSPRRWRYCLLNYCNSTCNRRRQRFLSKDMMERLLQNTPDNATKRQNLQVLQGRLNDYANSWNKNDCPFEVVLIDLNDPESYEE